MTRRCAKCGGAMVAGAIVDRDQGVRQVSSWLEGPVVKGWFGLKLRGKKLRDIETYRCDRCGVLESYVA